MNAYSFTLRCRWCGGECEHVTGGETAGFDSRAIAKCRECKTRWIVVVRLVDPSAGKSKQTPRRAASVAAAQALSPPPPHAKSSARVMSPHEQRPE